MRNKYLWATLFLGLLVLAAVPLIGADEKPAAEAEAASEVATAVAAAESEADEAEATFANDAEKFSYAIGSRMGQQLKLQLMDLDVGFSLEQYIRGLRAAAAGEDLALSDSAMQQVVKEFHKQVMAKQEAKRKKEGAENQAAGEAFLAANAEQEGVTVLPSGLQYKVLKEGTGESPSLNDRVKALYRGTFLDGTVFDSTDEDGEPRAFGLQGVIDGWTEALQLMKVGDKWQLFVPADLAYGEKGRPPRIGPNQTLIFEVELVEVIKVQPGQQPAGNPLRITPPKNK